jgi:hypothetical protein
MEGAMEARRYMTGAKARPVILALEPRLMFDGAAVAERDNAVAPTATSESPAAELKEVAFIDTGLPDAHTLAASLRPHGHRRPPVHFRRQRPRRHLQDRRYGHRDLARKAASPSRSPCSTQCNGPARSRRIKWGKFE